MSAAKSTPTPWAPEPEPKPHGFGVVDANGRTVCRIPLRLTSPLPPTEELCAQAQWIEQRIVQCVNAHDELAARAAKYQLLMRWLRDGHIPGPGYGTRIKLVEIDPLFGEEAELRDVEAKLDAAIAKAGSAALAKAGSDGTPSSPSAKAGSAS